MNDIDLEELLIEFEQDIYRLLTEGTTEEELNEEILAIIILLFMLGAGYTSDEELTTDDREWLDEMFRMTIASVPGMLVRHERGTDMSATALKVKNHALGAYHYALMAVGAEEDEDLWWDMGDTEHCGDCFSYSAMGFRPAGEWQRIAVERNHYPQSPHIECKGLHCQCRMRRRGKA